jgi:hypothetical protein
MRIEDINNILDKELMANIWLKKETVSFVIPEDKGRLILPTRGNTIDFVDGVLVGEEDYCKWESCFDDVRVSFDRYVYVLFGVVYFYFSQIVNNNQVTYSVVKVGKKPSPDDFRNQFTDEEWEDLLKDGEECSECGRPFDYE